MENKIIDAERVILKVRESLEAHRTPTGYSRFIGSGDNEYGVADAINILYTIDEMPDRRGRNALADRLKAFQSDVTGLFDEGSHPAMHCTAHCLAALELLDEGADYAIPALDHYREASGVDGFLSSLKWETTDGSGHVGAGVFSALWLTRTITPEF